MFKKLLGAVALLMMSAFATVYATVPLGVDTAVTAAQTDAETVAGYVLIAIAGLIGVFWMIGILRRQS